MFNYAQVQLCTLMFQATRDKIIPMDVLATLRGVVGTSGSWQMFRIARQAMRYAQYSFAEHIFSLLAYKVGRLKWMHMVTIMFFCAGTHILTW